MANGRPSPSPGADTHAAQTFRSTRPTDPSATRRGGGDQRGINACTLPLFSRLRRKAESGSPKAEPDQRAAHTQASPTSTGLCVPRASGRTRVGRARWRRAYVGGCSHYCFFSFAQGQKTDSFPSKTGWRARLERDGRSPRTFFAASTLSFHTSARARASDTPYAPPPGIERAARGMEIARSHGLMDKIR